MESREYMELLKQAWKDVFEVDEVADDADFFEEGGDSIKAVQLASWLMQKGVKLDLGKIFYTPVLSQMAETLEETDPVYVPEELMTKELAAKMARDIVNGQEADKTMPLDSKQSTGGDQRVCDPEKMAGDNDQRVCDPEKMAGDNDQRICDPEKMAGGSDQRVCDPDEKAFRSVRRDPSIDVMLSMFQTMMQQQQVMLQMMQFMVGKMMSQPPVFHTPMRDLSAEKLQKRFGKMKPRKMSAQDYPPEVRAEFEKRIAQYQSRKVDKPVDKPNVIGLQAAKVSKPEHSAQEVLDHVLGGLLKNGFNKTDDLFEQGLTSLDTVKMVTRCGEHGYSLSMQDIYMHSTYNELLECMKPGK